MPAFVRSTLRAVSMAPNLPASGRADKLAPAAPVIGGLRPGSLDLPDRLAVSGRLARKWKIDDERLANSRN
jgi:hypothetical protein